MTQTVPMAPIHSVITDINHVSFITYFDSGQSQAAHCCLRGTCLINKVLNL